MPLPSGSKLPLAMTCAASAVLPQTDRIIEAGTRGTGIHDFLRNCASMPREEALARVPDGLRMYCDAIDVAALPLGGDFESEAAFAYDVETEAVRFLGYDIGRQYGERGPNELFLSLDTVGVADGVALVGDWKTGRTRLAPAATNWQTRAGALVVARWKGLERARVALVHLGEDGQPYFDVADFDDFDLAGFAAELRELNRRLKQPLESLRPVAGSHCKYCPAFESCPAQGALMLRMASEPVALGQEIAAELTADTAARAYERIKAVEGVLNRVREALYTYASSTPIHLADGRMLGPVQTSREYLDAHVVRAVLAEQHGPEVAEAACDFETSKAAVQRALATVRESKRQGGEKATLKDLVATALTAVAERGGVARKTRTEVREHKPREEVET